MKGQAIVILSIIFIIIISVFAVTNVDTVEVNYLFWSGEAPLIFVILFSVLMGVILTALFSMKKVFETKKEMRILKKESQQLAEQLAAYQKTMDNRS